MVGGKIFYSQEDYLIAGSRLILQLLNNAYSHSNANISAHRRKWICYVLEFKFIHSEYNDICLVAIAVILFK